MNDPFSPSWHGTTSSESTVRRRRLRISRFLSSSKTPNRNRSPSSSFANPSSRSRSSATACSTRDRHGDRRRIEGAEVVARDRPRALSCLRQEVPHARRSEKNPRPVPRSRGDGMEDQAGLPASRQLQAGIADEDLDRLWYSRPSVGSRSTRTRARRGSTSGPGCSTPSSSTPTIVSCHAGRRTTTPTRGRYRMPSTG